MEILPDAQVEGTHSTEWTQQASEKTGNAEPSIATRPEAVEEIRPASSVTLNADRSQMTMEDSPPIDALRESANDNPPTGIAVYEKYYLAVVERVLKLFFFVSALCFPRGLFLCHC